MFGRRSLILTLFLALLLFGCGLSGMEQPATSTPVTERFDEATGLILNPDIIPDGPFVVNGEAIGVTLIPRDKPLFKIRAENGQVYQLVAQPVSEIFMPDGEQPALHQLNSGIVIQATVVQGDDIGLQQEPVLTSENLVVLELAN